MCLARVCAHSVARVPRLRLSLGVWEGCQLHLAKMCGWAVPSACAVLSCAQRFSQLIFPCILTGVLLHVPSLISLGDIGGRRGGRRQWGRSGRQGDALPNLLQSLPPRSRSVPAGGWRGSSAPWHRKKESAGCHEGLHLGAKARVRPYMECDCVDLTVDEARTEGLPLHCARPDNLR